MGGSFFVGNGEGIEELVKPIFVRGLPLPWLAYLAASDKFNVYVSINSDVEFDISG
jgi:hypothetical protein